MKALETVTRISLKNILYTTDFSPTAEAAAPFAWELARRYGAKVIALHVRVGLERALALRPKPDVHLRHRDRTPDLRALDHREPRFLGHRVLRRLLRFGRWRRRDEQEQRERGSHPMSGPMVLRHWWSRPSGGGRW